MATVSLILLAAYALGVMSLLWHIRQTAALADGRGGIDIIEDHNADWPSIDVVVPVKDEEHNIALCLNSILADPYPNVHIFVVNDRSTDGTVRVVQAIQDRHPHIERLDITELPPGVFGKPNAVEKVASRLKSEYVVFIDSDMQLRPGCLRSIVDHMQKEKLDWFAAYGEPELTQFWERLLAPIFGAMAYSWYDPRKISDPNWPDAIGSGFMVARREAYEAVGGHTAVKDQYDEDSVLLRLAKSLKQRVEFVISPNLYRVKLYGDLRRTLRGFNRTMIGGLKTVPRFLVTIHALQFISLLPYLIPALVLLLGAAGVTVPYSPYWLVAGGLHIIFANVLVWQIFRTAKQPLAIALLHPLGSIVAIWACSRAALDLIRGKPITWRGTSYAGAESALPTPGR